MKSFIFSLIVSCISLPVIADEGYVPFNPSNTETVDGKTLLVVSYGIVLGLLALYWAYVTFQTQKTSATISDLERELEQ